MKNNQLKTHEPSKRHFLLGLSALIGSAAVSQLATADALASAFSYDTQADSALKKGKLFSQFEMKILHDICAVVLPKTDTPSAAELDVHGFLDHQLFTCYDTKKQQQAVSLVNSINEQSKANFSKVFTEISAAQQTELLVALESQSLGFTENDQAQFRAFKSLLVFGYFTTEVGATQALNYQAIPGGFKGSISYSSLKKSWGSLGFY